MPEHSDLDFLSFNAGEQHNFTVSLHNQRHVFDLATRLEEHFQHFLRHQRIDGESDVIVFLCSDIHQRFYVSVTNTMRQHFKVAFLVARVAVESAMLAVLMIHERSLQREFMEGGSKFNNPRSLFLKKLEKNSKLEVARELPAIHKSASKHSSHASVSMFIDRLRFRDGLMQTLYFEIPQSDGDADWNFAIVLATYLRCFKSLEPFAREIGLPKVEEWIAGLEAIDLEIGEIVKKNSKLRSS